MIQGFFSNAKKILLEGGFDFANDTIKVGILKSTYTLDPTDDVWGDVSAHEVAESGGYVAGGVALSGKTVAEDDVNEEGVFDCTDLIIAGLTAADVQYFIFYKDGVVKSLIGYVDLEAPAAYTGQSIKLTVNANGIIRAI